jgi:predicted HTH domain antitoxin
MLGMLSNMLGRKTNHAKTRRSGIRPLVCAVLKSVKWTKIMSVTIDLPEDISAALTEQWDDVPRRSLEAIAVEAYRTGALTESQIRRLLGFETRFEVHALLKEHQVPLRYTAADLEEDLSAHRQLGILPSR